MRKSLRNCLLIICTAFFLNAQAQPTSGTSMATDGSTQFASTPNGMMEGLTTFTCETWIKTTENKSSGLYWQKPTLLGNARSGSPDGDFGITTDNGMLGIWSGIGAENSLQTTIDIKDNLWHHVAVVKNGGTLTLFSDGINIGSIAVGISSGPATSDAPLTLGGSAHNINWGIGENAALIATFHQGEFAETRFSSNARYSANFTPAGSFTTDANTVALYHYGACQREISTDASANANFLSGRFAAPTCATGLPFTKAINYNGVDQSAFLPDGVMNGLTNFTIEGWIKSTDVNTSANGNLWQAPVIVSKEDPAGASGDLVLTTQGGYLSMLLEPLGSSYQATTYKYFISDNQWHHWAASADGTTCRFFVDGILQGGSPIGAGINVSAAQKFALMGDDNLTTYIAKNHSGFLEEVRFSSTARYTASFTPPTAAFTNNAATVALYKSNDCPGANTLTDASSNGNNAVLNNFIGGCDVSALTKPGSGNAVSFDGVDDYVELPKVLNALPQFTIEFWVKTTENRTSGLFWQNPTLIGNVNPGAPDGDFGITTNNGQLGVWSGICPCGDQLLQTTKAINDNQWHHVAAVNDGSIIQLYVDGILLSGSIPSTGGTGLNLSQRALNLGASNSCCSGINAHAGNMDEVKLWNTALTEAQIRDRMCRKIESTDALYANLLTYYNFDETAGNTCYNKVNEIINYAYLTNGPTRLTSGAAIGNTSASSYTGAAATATLTNTPRGDAFTATLNTGGADGIQVYSVNQAPNISTGVTGIGDNNAYFGTFVVNGTSPTYTAVYNYNGVTITKNNDNRLFKRTDNAATSWADAAATNNTGAKTLTATGQNTEYILGSAGKAGIVTTVANLSPCKGSIIPVTFTITGVLQTGNTFTAQLSNAAGSFASPVAIGSVAITTATATPYTIAATIPANTVDGAAYRIRIVSSSPAVTGAANTGNISILTPAIPTVTASGATTFCAGGSVTLTSSAATTYLWSNGATTQSINVNASGTFTLTTTNASGCVSAASLSTTVTVNPVPARPTISANGATTFCAGGTVTLTSSAASGNVWNNGAITPSIIVNASGIYTVTTTNGNGCSSAASLATTVTVNPIPATPTISASGATTFCAGGTVTLTSSAASGNLWNNGAITPSIIVNTSGIYTVTTTNENGCSSAASLATTVTVNPVPATPTITAGGTITDVCPGKTVTLTSSAASSYIWNTGAVTQSIVVSEAGSYSVAVTNANGCLSENSTSVNVTYRGCAKPTGLVTGNITATSAKLSWNAVTCAVGYQYEFRVKGTIPYTKGQQTGVNKTITGLLSNTIYQWRVITGCKISPDTITSQGYSTGPEFTTIGSALFAGDGNSKLDTKVIIEHLTAKLIPNPATSIATLNISNAVGNVHIKLTDLSGKTIWQNIPSSQNTFVIQVSHLAQGIYMVTVSDDKETKVMKLVKE